MHELNYVFDFLLQEKIKNQQHITHELQYRQHLPSDSVYDYLQEQFSLAYSMNHPDYYQQYRYQNEQMKTNYPTLYQYTSYYEETHGTALYEVFLHFKEHHPHFYEKKLQEYYHLLLEPHRNFLDLKYMSMIKGCLKKLFYQKGEPQWMHTIPITLEHKVCIERCYKRTKDFFQEMKNKQIHHPKHMLIEHLDLASCDYYNRTFYTDHLVVKEQDEVKQYEQVYFQVHYKQPHKIEMIYY